MHKVIDAWPDQPQDAKKSTATKKMGIVNAMRALIHILARSSLQNHEAPLTHKDYFCVLKLVGAGLAMGIGAASFFYTSSFIFPGVVSAISIGDKALFYQVLYLLLHH